MGDPRRLKKKFKKPRHPYQKDRIMEELEFIGRYGLRNKREFWKSRSTLGRWREQARYSRTLPKKKSAEVQQTLIKKLARLGVVEQTAELDDVLALGVEDVLKRRLQTLVYEKGLAKTPYQARQMIVHGHIIVKGRKIDSPSYLVKKEEEGTIGFAPTSSFSASKQEA